VADRTLAADPNRVVHVGLHVFARHPAVLAVAGRVADQKRTAARLRGVVAKADQQDAVAVADGLARTHLQHALLPAFPLGPQESAAYGPPLLERALDLGQLLVGQALVRVPLLDPVKLQSQRLDFLGVG
jgi:hypothetical protein